MPSSTHSESNGAAGALCSSAAMRAADSALLSLALMDARNHTLALFGQFDKVLAAGRPVAPTVFCASPLWLLGYVGWYGEWWIGRNTQRALGAACPPQPTRLSSIESESDAWWNPAQTDIAARWLAVPNAEYTRAYLLATLEGTLELLDKAPNEAAALYFYRRCLFEEDMQAEAMLQSAQALGVVLQPHFLDALTPPSRPARAPLWLAASEAFLGSSGGAWAFDNELPRHTVSVPEFEIDAQAVTWAQYVEFVADRGYDRAELWAPGGWAFLQQFELAASGAPGRRAPGYVEQMGVASGAVVQTRFGRSLRASGSQAALHVSWWEADAWCRWAGRRLPYEVEWESAALSAAQRGFVWGDVWEWTLSSFGAYPGNPGFRSDPDAAYSASGFVGHKVLKGGSFATRQRLKNPHHRRFALPERDDMFCGFRSCSL